MAHVQRRNEDLERLFGNPMRQIRRSLSTDNLRARSPPNKPREYISNNEIMQAGRPLQRVNTAAVNNSFDNSLFFSLKNSVDPIERHNIGGSTIKAERKVANN